MVSKEVYEYIEQGNVKELYKKFTKAFLWTDEWSDKLIDGDLLDENELAFMIDKSTGIYAKLCPIVNAMFSYMERVLNNEESKYYKSQEKVKSVDPAIAKATARDKASDVRDYHGDFSGYLEAVKQNICSAQSRLKRLVVEKGAKGVGYTGERPVETTEDEEGDWNE